MAVVSSRSGFYVDHSGQKRTRVIGQDEHTRRSAHDPGLDELKADARFRQFPSSSMAAVPRFHIFIRGHHNTLSNQGRPRRIASLASTDGEILHNGRKTVHRLGAWQE